MHLVEMFSHLLKADQLSAGPAFASLGRAYLGFVDCHRQHDFNPSPGTLLRDMQEWVDRTPESDLPLKGKKAGEVLLYLAHKEDLLMELGSHTSDLEKQYLRSFAQFFVDFDERHDIKNFVHWPSAIDHSLAAFRTHLDPISS